MFLGLLVNCDQLYPFGLCQEVAQGNATERSNRGRCAGTLAAVRRSYVGEVDLDRMFKLGLTRRLDLRLDFFDRFMQAIRRPIENNLLAAVGAAANHKSGSQYRYKQSLRVLLHHGSCADRVMKSLGTPVRS